MNRWRAVAAVLGIVALASLVPAVRHLRETPPTPEATVVLTLPPPTGAEFATAIDLPLDVAIAPSSREVVFAASMDGRVQLWRRALDSTRAVPIAGTDAAMMPAYSGDGTSVWFFAGGRLREASLEKESTRDVITAPAPGGVSVRRDRAVLFVPARGPIKRLTGAGAADATALEPGDAAHAFPSWTGRGDAFVYLAVRDDGRHVLRLKDGDDESELARADSHGVVVADHLVFVREGTLRAEPLNPGRRERPRSQTLAFDVGVSSAGQGAFAISDRLLVWTSRQRRAGILRWYTAGGEPLAPIAEPGDFWQVRLSPDERTVALTVRDALLRTFDVFTVPAAGGHPVRFTLALGADTDPVWSPDGRRIAFRSSQSGQTHLYTRRFGPSGPSVTDDLLLETPLDEIPTDWRGRDVIYHARSPETGFDIWGLPPSGTPQPLVRSAFNEIDGRVSPDGRWLAYAADDAGQFDVYVQPLDGVRVARVRVSTGGGVRPQWTAGGRSLVFRRGDDVMRADVVVHQGAPHASLPAKVLSVAGVRDAAVTSDFTRLLVLAGGEPSGSPAYAAVGWTALLSGPPSSTLVR